MIFETHAHYDDEQFDEDREQPVSYTHLDNEKTALVMYQELVYQIGQNADKFYAEGVKREEMSEQLEKVKERLRTDLTIQNRGCLLYTSG